MMMQQVSQQFPIHLMPIIIYTYDRDGAAREDREIYIHYDF